MAMNLRSKGIKTSSGKSDPQSSGSTSTNATPTPEIVITSSTTPDNAQQQNDDRLATLAEVQRGWAKQVHANFSTGARVPWNSFWNQFENMTWERKYLDEGSGTWVSLKII